MEESNAIEENLIYEDAYESFNEQILSQLSQMESHNQTLQALKQANQKKMSKLKLLLYQKMFNIVFSIVSQHFHSHFSCLMKYSRIQLKGYVMNNKKYKLPQFYVHNMVKHQERQEKIAQFKENHSKFNQKRLQDDKEAKKKSNAEIEYERFREKARLEKINKEEREKMKQDYIRKETYADNIYRYIVKRRFFRILKLSMELNDVAGLFIDNINKRITLITYIKRMQIAAKAKQEAELKAEQLKLFNASLYYQRNLKGKLMHFLANFGELSVKVQNYLSYQLKLKRRKRAWLKYKKGLNQVAHEDYKLMNVIIDKKRNRLKRLVYFRLKGVIAISRDEKLKTELMAKLKSKAMKLFDDFK